MANYFIKVGSKRIDLAIETQKLGSGGEGEVFRVIAPHSLSGLCFKKYVDKYQNQEKHHKIEFMIDNPPQNLQEETVKICWPRHVVYTDYDKFVGYLMPLAYEDSQEMYHLTLNKSKRLDSGWQKFFNDTQESCDLSLKICVNLCSAIYAIHCLKTYIFVDFKPQNVMFTKDGRVSLVDCDSLQINSDDVGNPHYGRVNTAEYTPPEGVGVVVSNSMIDESWDRFSLAVVLYQLMFRIHPYTATFTAPYQDLSSVADKIKNNLFVHGRGNKYLVSLPPPHQGFIKLNSKIRKLFLKAFDSNPKQRRPSAEDWGRTLYDLVQKNKHGLKPQGTLQPKASPLRTYSPKAFLASKKEVKSVPPPVNIKVSSTVSNQSNISNTNTVIPKNKASYKLVLWLIILAVITYVIMYSDFNERFIYDNGEGMKEVFYDSKDEAYDIEQALNPENQCFYVLYEKANLRSRASLKGRVVAVLDYNTKVCTTGMPEVKDVKQGAWLNVVSDNNKSGWMASSTLSPYSRTVLQSQCYVEKNEKQYVVNAVGVNIRSYPSQNEKAVIGVMKKDEIVCPYKYVVTDDPAIGRWLGFTLANGEAAWIAESLVEPL